MIQIGRILCPIDYSACSRRAFSQAVALARWHRASITALHVSEDMINGEGMRVPSSLALARPTRHELEADVIQFVAALQDAAVPVNVAVEEGPVAGRIADAARRLDADLIVMGIHGRLNLLYLTLGTIGSVTQEVIRAAPCPVMVVPPARNAATEVVEYQHILCPVDFGAASLRAVEYSLSLAQETGASLVLLHVLDMHATALAPSAQPHAFGEQEARRALSALIPADARNYCRPAEVLTTGTPHQEILRTANALQADLIVMGVGARSAADLMLLGSTADPVLRSATCPVLTVSARTH